MKIAELQEQIHTAHPRMPMLLKDIHAILKADPDNVTLLSEEDIGIIVSGLKKQTATEIAASITKKKSLKSVTAMDL
jgi:ribosomal protein L6P/L9E